MHHPGLRCEVIRLPTIRPSTGNAPGRIRTSDPQLRRLLLYPTELRALGITKPQVNVFVHRLTSTLSNNSNNKSRLFQPLLQPSGTTQWSAMVECLQPARREWVSEHLRRDALPCWAGNLLTESQRWLNRSRINEICNIPGVQASTAALSMHR